MNFAFTDEQKLFQNGVRTALAKACTPVSVRAAWESESGLVDGAWQTLAELGVAGLMVPEEHGGLGMSALDLVLPLEETGRACMPGPVFETALVAVPLVTDLGKWSDHTFRSHWCPKLVSGEVLCAVNVDGAPHVAFAEEASLLFLRTETELHAVTLNDVKLTRQRSVDGARRLFTVAWTPTRDTLVAEGEHAARAMADAFDRGALGASAQLLGLADRMIAMTVDYVKVRQQFGQAIGGFQAVKHHLADALMALSFARPAVYRAAYSVAERDPKRAMHVSLGKALASDAARSISKLALQCHGAIGYSYEYDLHLYMKRAWALAAAWGDAAFHRARIGAEILDGDASKQFQTTGGF